MDINFDSNNPGAQRKLSFKIILTLVLIALVRFGSFIPIPGVDQNYLYAELKNSQILNFFSSFSLGNFFVLGFFSLGILPNINASILIQLLIVIFPPLKRIQREGGKASKNKIKTITRILTAIIALQYSFIIAFYLKPFVFGWTILNAIKIASILTIGSLIVSFFSELITEQGIGNGTSIIIFVNISSSLPVILENFNSSLSFSLKCVFILLFFTSVFCIIFIQNGTRKIDLISLKQLVRLSTRTESTYIPFRLNPSGILPLIFTSSLINILLAILTKFGFLGSWNTSLNLFYVLGYFILTLFFSFLYSSLIINPKDLANDLNNLSFTVPSIAPGVPTMKFLQDTLNRLALLGGLFLAFATSVPSLFIYLSPSISGIKGFGSTSLLILVGVTVDLSRQIQTYMISESYDKIEM